MMLGDLEQVVTVMLAPSQVTGKRWDSAPESLRPFRGIYSPQFPFFLVTLLKKQDLLTRQMKIRKPLWRPGILGFSRLGFKDNARWFLTRSHVSDDIYCPRINEGTDFGRLAGTDGDYKATTLRFRRVGQTRGPTLVGGSWSPLAEGGFVV